MVTLDDIRLAAKRIEGVVPPTPLLAAKFGPEQVLLKCENLQRAGSFKIRGAYNNVAQLDAAARARGVTAYSSGNHAQGVALAAQLLGVPAVIVMLNGSIQEKVDQTRAYGAEVLLGGELSEEIRRVSEGLAAERGLTLIPPFNSPGTIAGQGTVGLEILRDCPEVDTVVVPVGGGGLVSGVATAIKSLRKQTRVIGVEPKGAPKMSRALEAGRLVTLESNDTICDGLKPVRAGELTFEHVRAYVDEMVLVDDDEVREAMKRLIVREKLMVEPSGAATFAAVTAGRIDVRGPTVCVLSGGNASLKLLRSIL